MSGPNEPVLGYVVGGDEHEFVAVCTDCFPQFGEAEGVMRDDETFGDRVPYPECHSCGEVMRP